MKTQEFLLEQRSKGFSNSECFEKLTEQFAIKVKHYENEGIVLLDYHMIDSPKTHPIVIECRSLILDFNDFSIVSKKFDRFFNYGEAQEYYSDFDLSSSLIMEKADGSLIGIYHHKGKWNISTRGMAFAEGEHYSSGVSFKDKVLEAFELNDESFQDVFKHANPHLTLIFEYTSPENRVVTKYEKTEMVFLGATIEGRELPYDQIAWELENVLQLKHRQVKMYKASNFQEIVNLANSLPNLEEGFVLYDTVRNKRMKVKSSLYVVAHSIRGNDPLPTRKNLLKLLFSGELDEFTSYFPEWFEKAETVRKEIYSVLKNLNEAWNLYKNIENQKDFAISIKNVKHNSILFQAKKTKTDVLSVWQNIPIDKKMNMFEKEST